MYQGPVAREICAMVLSRIITPKRYDGEADVADSKPAPP